MSHKHARPLNLMEIEELQTHVRRCMHGHKLPEPVVMTDLQARAWPGKISATTRADVAGGSWELQRRWRAGTSSKSTRGTTRVPLSGPRTPRAAEAEVIA